ncbi:MAG: hypothetical protein A2017_22240 [Lentisphaerae bacterium GWF2_44_16]|nr:MAG: hypothetical protein A2017_22240 [Lentisphaerae bacterium GWF2_44_16]
MKHNKLLILCLVFSMMHSLKTEAKNLDVNKGVFTLSSGEYEIDISSECKYTIRSIKYENYYLCPSVGYNATVIIPEGGKFIGAGHTEGGEEQVESIEFSVDGKKISPAPGEKYSGQKIILKKTSTLDKLRLVSVLTLTPECITENKQFEAVEAQKISLMYIFFYCWNKTTTDWYAELADNKKLSGTFKDDRSYHLKKDIKWAAEYDNSSQKGVIMYYPSVIPGKGIKSTFWDVGGIYHKYYHQLDIPLSLPKGFKSPAMTIILKGFSASPDNWKTEVEKNTEDLNSLKVN